jgi:hypothetical protein
MFSVKVKQRVNVKFLEKLGMYATKTYHLLMSVCLAHVFEWFQRLKEGRGETEDDPRPGELFTSKTVANIENVGEIVRKNRCQSIRAVVKLANIDKEKCSADCT